MEEKQSKRSKIITIVGRILIILLIFAGVGLYILQMTIIDLLPQPPMP